MDRYRVVKNTGLISMEGGHEWSVEDTKLKWPEIGGFDDKEIAEKVVAFLNKDENEG